MRYFHRTIHYHYYTPRERKIYSQMCLNNAIQFGLIPGVKSELPGVVHIDENDRHQCNEFWHERGMLNIGNSVGVRDAERIKKYYLRYKDEWTDEEKEKFLKVLSNFVYSVDELENIENISFR